MKERLEARIEAQVVEGHARKCPWTTRGCHETLLRLGLADRDMSLAAYGDRVASLRAANEEEQAWCNKATATTTTTHGGAELAPEEFSAGIDVLALFGWSFEIQDSLRLLVCRDCHRRVQIHCDRQAFSVAEEHYDYCPWVSQKTQGTESGWKILLKHWNKINMPQQIRVPDSQDNTKGIEKNTREQLRQVRRKLGFT